MKKNAMMMYRFIIQFIQGLHEDMINKLQKDIFNTVSDKILECFQAVTRYDSEQVLRYCRDEVFPLWFCNNELLTMKNTKCKNCNGDLIFEFQVLLINTRLCLMYSICLRR